MVKVYDVTYPAYTGPETRKMYIYLPEGYFSSPGKRYPVLYAFDGHNLFFDDHATYGKSWGLGDYLDRTGTELIVASVECNHSPDGGRLSEYGPFDFADLEDDKKLYKGRGEETFDYYINTLKPFVDGTFRTLPDREHTFIMGSSMGGIMSLYGVLKHNDIYSRAAVLSCSYWANWARLYLTAKTAKIGDDTVVYIDFGDSEFYGPNRLGRFREMNDILLSRGVKLTARLVPGGTHCEACWEKQLQFAIPAIVYGIE